MKIYLIISILLLSMLFMIVPSIAQDFAFDASGSLLVSDASSSVVIVDALNHIKELLMFIFVMIVVVFLFKEVALK